MFFEPNHTSVKLTGQLGRVVGKYVRRKSNCSLDEAKGGIAARVEEIVIFDERLWSQFIVLGLEKRELHQEFLEFCVSVGSVEMVADIAQRIVAGRAR